MAADFAQMPAIEGQLNGRRKSKAYSEDYCDGLGDCSPPAQRVQLPLRKERPQHMTSLLSLRQRNKKMPLPCGCPGTNAKAIHREAQLTEPLSSTTSQLSQWPVQIKLAPVNAPYFENANLLIAAVCTAYAYGNFHNDFIRNHITLIGCPKLDDVDYSEKLTQIIANNNIKSVTVVRMEVPCCGGIEHAVKTALQASGKFIPWSVVTISTDGKILD